MKKVRPTLSVASLTFSDGNTYEFSPRDKVLIVGPNNSGKSIALREIRGILAADPGHSPLEFNKCVTEIELKRNSTSADMEAFMKNHGTRDASRTDAPYYKIGPYSFHLLLSRWYGGNNLGDLSKLFCRYIGTENRLSATLPSKSTSTNDQAADAQQILYDNEPLFNQVSAHFKASFGQALVIDYRGGSSIPIHVGEPPALEAGTDRISESYVSRVRKLPRLHDQGDGMRGYAGILFEATVTTHDITLLDEPEAFLHPPQMRRLARTLAEHNEGQLFTATHSSDILRGFLDAHGADTRIIRLQRSGDKNVSKETSVASLRELWDNPDLKYSNALEGIFHEICVICEDDSDCRFYNAIADFMSASDQQGRWPDSVYVPCGGKHAIPKLASALHTLGVPVRIVVDLDALSEEALLEKLVKSLGGDWVNLKKDWKIFRDDVQRGVKLRTADEIKEDIHAILADSTGLPKSRIIDAMKGDNVWNVLKNAGKSAIPKGNCRAAYDRLEAALSALGIFVVPEGQIEGFLPAIGSHGPGFVSSALKTIGVDADDMQSARDFVRRVAGPL